MAGSTNGHVMNSEEVVVDRRPGVLRSWDKVATD